MDGILPFFQRRILQRAPPTEISSKYKFRGHQDPISSFIFFQDNVHIVSGSEDGTMRKWNCETGLLVGKPWRGNSAIIYTLALSPDGKTIACGRGDGTVERWDTNGQMMKDIWKGHSDRVRSVSWSPSGGDIASGSEDGTMLIRNTESGQLKLDPIKTKQGWMYSVAYSPSGDGRIASGGSDSICIWDSHTGDLLVGPIEGLGPWVYSLVWSLDGTKLYSASDQFARVFDSTSGTLLHRLKHDHFVYSIALSPTHNVLACVGWKGVAQLWDTESHQPLPHRFPQDGRRFMHVSFSPDGQYLAYGRYDNTITLWSVKDIAPIQGGPEQENPLNPTSSDVHATNPLAQSAVDDIMEEAHTDNPYDEFFASSKSSLPLPFSPNRPDLLPSLFHSARNESMPFHERIAVRLRSRRALSNSPLHVPAIGERTEPTPKGKFRAGNKDEEHDGVHCSANVASGAPGPSNDKGKRREESVVHMQTSSPAELDSDENRALLKSLMRDRRKGSSMDLAKITHDLSPTVVEVYAARGFKRYVAYKRKPKKKPPVNTHIVPAHASSSSQANLSQGNTVHGGPSSQSMSIAGDAVQPSQVTGANIATDDDDLDSDSMIQGGCNIFLDKICFPCGHHKDDT